MNGFAAAVIAAWLACVVLEVAFLAWDSEWAGRFRRRDLEARLAGSNLAPMLQRHGVNADAFAQDASVAELQVHVERCDACAEKKRYDAALATEHPLEGRVGFCPNEQVLERSGPR